jgi:hypothetical protein
MSEINGLRALLSSPGTLHSLGDPPQRKDFDSDEAYDAAYVAWQLPLNTWKTEWTGEQ